MNDLKVFTVDEANKLLPRLAPLLNQLKSVRYGLLKQEVEIDALELIHPVQGDQVPPLLKKAVECYNEQVKKFYALIDLIHGHGYFVKDVEMGLIDFYGRQKGEIVYLCWKLGEPEIGHWHEIGQGFMQRRPLADKLENENKA